MGKVLTRDELRGILTLLKSAGRKIVFTNGCFDIVHRGHIRYLRQAASLGDILVVGLNSDYSVGRIKPGRPVNGQDDRAEVLAALEMVDYVTVFDEETPYNLIAFIRPDVLVKGGDWKREDIVGSDLVPEVHSLDFVEGVSTTGIIGRIRNHMSEEHERQESQ